MTAATDRTTDDEYPDPSAPGFYPYWLGRVRGALSYLLDHPTDPIADRLARRTMDAYALRTGQAPRPVRSKAATAAHYAGLAAEAADDADLYDRCDTRTTGEGSA